MTTIKFVSNCLIIYCHAQTSRSILIKYK